MRVHNATVWRPGPAWGELTVLPYLDFRGPLRAVAEDRERRAGEGGEGRREEGREEMERIEKGVEGKGA